MRRRRPACPSAGWPAESSTTSASTCAAGTATKVVLYLQAARSQPDALAFCRQQHGPGAGLVGGDAAVLAAAKSLVQSNLVGGPSVPSSQAVARLPPDTESKPAAPLSLGVMIERQAGCPATERVG
jgi:hypothetical protein